MPGGARATTHTPACPAKSRLERKLVGILEGPVLDGLHPSHKEEEQDRLLQPFVDHRPRPASGPDSATRASTGVEQFDRLARRCARRIRCPSGRVRPVRSHSSSMLAWRSAIQITLIAAIDLSGEAYLKPELPGAPPPVRDDPSVAPRPPAHDPRRRRRTESPGLTRRPARRPGPRPSTTRRSTARAARAPRGRSRRRAAPPGSPPGPARRP